MVKTIVETSSESLKFSDGFWSVKREPVLKAIIETSSESL